jgi:outer membrane protein TolC
MKCAKGSHRNNMQRKVADQEVRFDTLHAIQQDADGLKAASAAEDAAAITLALTKRQLDAGYANYLALLSAEQAYPQTLINLVQAQSNRYSDTAAPFQALGGGWWKPTGFAQELIRGTVS